MPLPSDLVWVKADGSTVAAADFDLLAVAYGLSFHPAQFPPTWLPGDMSPLDLPRLPRVPPDVDEWYPK